MSRAHAAKAMTSRDVAALLEVEVEVDEGAGVAPLTPEKARRRAEKQQRLQQRIRAEDERHASKERDLLSQIHGT